MSEPIKLTMTAGQKGVPFTALKSFTHRNELGGTISEYVENKTYKVVKGNIKLANCVAKWVEEGKVELGG